jgi:Predicted ATPase
MSQIGSNREEKGICIGEIIGILKRSSFSSSKISTNSNYKWVSYRSKFYINLERNKNFNIIIVGGSGSGKSHLAKNIIRKGNFHFLIFDIHGEYDVNAKRIDVSKISINPLSLFGQSPRQRALEVAYMIKSIFNLGSLQTIDLSNIIVDTYGEKGIFEDDERTWNLPPPNFRDVLMLLEKKKKLVTTSQELNKIQSLEPYIYFLATNTFMDNSINLYDLISDDYVLDFSKVTIPEIKYVIIETILRSILAYMYISGLSNFRKMIVIDEAPFILSKESGEQLMERLFAESRKFGFGFILISQSVEYVRKLIPNTSYVFALNIVDPTEIDFISRLIGGQDPDIFKAIYNSLPKLERGLIITRDILRDEIILVRSN